MEINASNFFTSASSFDNDNSSKDGSIDPSSGTSMNPQSIDPIHFWSTRTVTVSNAKQIGSDLSNPFAVICGVNQDNMQSMGPSAAVGAQQEDPLLVDMHLSGTIDSRKRLREDHYHDLDSPSSSHEESDDRHHEETAVDGTDGANHDGSSSSSKRRRPPRLTHPRLSWEERIEQLENYKKEHGDLLIPIRYKENPSLGKFVHNTREQYKLYQKHLQESSGNVHDRPTKRCSLTAERILQLEELGFAWSTERTKHQKEDWEARLQQLREYKAKHGDCLVPHGYTEDPSFAEWVHRQRTTHAHWMKEQSEHADTQRHQCGKHQLNPLVKQRMKLLEDLGFRFTVHADKWIEHWKELKAYKEVHGNCMVPTHCRENPQLGRWVHTQRHQRRLQLRGKKSCMTDERVQLLDSLGFSWDVRHHDNPNEASLLFSDDQHQNDYLSSDSDSNVAGACMDVVDPTMTPDRSCMLLAQHQQQNRAPYSNGDIFANGTTVV